MKHYLSNNPVPVRCRFALYQLNGEQLNWKLPNDIGSMKGNQEGEATMHVESCADSMLTIRISTAMMGAPASGRIERFSSYGAFLTQDSADLLLEETETGGFVAHAIDEGK